MADRIAYTLRGALMFLCLATAAAPARGAGDPENPYWPCIQRKVPVISAGMVWAGPEIPADDTAWKDSPRRHALAVKIAARRLPIEDAQEEIDRFAAALGPEKDQELTLLFAAVLQIVNAERSEIVTGIERYSRRQDTLSERIGEATAELNALRRKPGRNAEDEANIKTLEEQLLWDTRIFDERRQSLTYVCESPVLLEQRLFALSRHIMSHLE